MMAESLRSSDGTKWAFFKRFDITDSRGVYLRRWRLIQTPLFAIYLHRIFLEDADREPHDHPWNFTSLVLRGGYIEHILRTDTKVSYSRLNPRWSYHRMKTNAAHRIAFVYPNTYTLVFAGRRTRDWYFWTPDGPVLWSEWKGISNG
jgi:hypothetical protein